MHNAKNEAAAVRTSESQSKEKDQHCSGCRIR